ncbi:MAG: methyltransferase domain-containing protein [Vicinamibacterales bacterium]|nr:methyltransferase domain-containing protein [Vicinamibacterales bacterium]
MLRDQYEQMAELQDHHWWFAAKRRIVDTLVRQYATHGGDRRPAANWVLDAGCGTGSMLPVLRQWGHVIGTDVHRQGLQFVSHRPVLEADVLRLPFADQSFQLVGCFDVLYHRRVVDVEAVLRELHRVCRQQGLLVLTDSAVPALQSSHDTALHGVRRFRLESLQAHLEGAGFRVVYGSYFHTLLFPIAAIVRLTKRALEGTPGQPVSGSDLHVAHHSDLRPTPRLLNSVLGSVYRIEAALLQRTRLPIGLSVVVIARPADAD